MRIVCISDLHMETPLLPFGDLLIVAGDLTSTGPIGQTKTMLGYLMDNKHKYTHGVVMIAGNHDFLFQRDPLVAEQLVKDARITYLCESGCIINGFKIWGSPYVPRIGDWAFGYDQYMEHRIWQRIPEDTDILITHGAPMGILDDIEDRWHIGSAGLYNEIFNRVHPKLHVFGHVHEGYGTYDTEETKFVNASICDVNYDPTNKPVEVEI